MYQNCGKISSVELLGLWFRRVSPIYNCFLVWRESFVRHVISSTPKTPQFCSCLLKITLVLLYPNPMHESQTMNSDGRQWITQRHRRTFLWVAVSFNSYPISCVVSVLSEESSLSAVSIVIARRILSLTKKPNTEQGVRITPCTEDCKGYNYWQVY